MKDLILWSGLSLLVAGALSFTYLGTGDVRPAPAYYSFIPPPAGGTYRDPVFGTVIKRVSDATKTLDSAGPGHVPFVANEYSTMSPFNSDDSRFLLVHTSYFGL